MSDTQGQTIAAVERAADVLSLFAGGNDASLGVTEIAQRLGLSKAVVHRILASFRAKGFIDVDTETRRYRLGAQALALGLTYLDQIDVRTMARPVLSALVAATNETATLSLRLQHTRVYVDQVTPSRDIKMVVPLGQAFPLHAGGSSKALLAFLPAEEIDAYLAGGLTSVTDITVTDETALRDELAEIRERGYAVSYGERQAGAGSVAAPVLNHDGVPVAAISVCGPVERFRDEVPEIAEQLLGQVRGLWSRMGYRGPLAG